MLKNLNIKILDTFAGHWMKIERTTTGLGTMKVCAKFNGNSSYTVFAYIFQSGLK